MIKSGVDLRGLAPQMVLAYVIALDVYREKVGTTSGSTYTITGLSASTIYRVRIKFSDLAGNVSANYSERVNFTTATIGTILPRAPVSFSQPRLPRN